MADVNKSVEIQLNIKSSGLKEVDKLISSLDKLKDAAKTAKEISASFRDIFKGIEIPSTVGETLKGFQGFSLPRNFKSFIESLKELSNISDFSNIEKAAEAIKELKGAAAPRNFKSFVASLKELSDSSLNMRSVSSRLSSLKKALEGMKGLRVPSIDRLAKGLKEIGSLSLPELRKIRTNINGLVQALLRVESVNTAKITAFVQQLIRLGAIRPTDNIEKLAKSLESLKSLRVPNLTNLTKGLDDIKALGRIPNLDDLANELKKLSGLKIQLPNFKQLAQGMKILSEESVSASTATAKLRVLFRTLKNFTDIRVPNLKQLAEGMRILNDSAITGSDAATKLRILYRSLKRFSGLTIPNVKQLAEGLKILNDAAIKSSVAAEKIRAIHNAVKDLKGMTVPNIKQVAQGLKDLSKLGGAEMSTASANLKKFAESVRGFKDTRVPNINQLAEGLKKLSSIGKTDMGTAAANMRKAAEAVKSFGAVRVPNVAGLAAGLQKLLKLDVGKLVAKIKELDAALGRLGKIGGLKNFATFASDLNKVTRAMEKMTARTAPAFTTLGGFMRKLRSYSMYRVVADAVIGVKNATLEAARSVAEYDQSLKDLQAITQSTDQQVGEMASTIEEVAATTKFSVTEVANGMKVLGQSGLSASEAIQTMQSVSDLATGTLTNMNVAVDLITTAMRVFNKSATETSSIADVFANAVNKSKLTVEKLKTALNYVGPVAKEAGLSLEELNAAMMTLANAGIRPSSIGTGLRRVIAELVAPSKKFKQAVQEAGISLESIDPRVNSFSDVIKNLKLVVTDAGVAFESFGKRGATAVLALTQEGSNGFDKMYANVSKSGTAAKMAQKQMEGLSVSWKNLLDKIGLFVVKLGQLGITDVAKVIINALRGVITFLTKLIDNDFARFLAKTVAFSTALLGLVAVFNKLKAASAAVATTELAVMGTNIAGMGAAAEAATGTIASLMSAISTFAPELIVLAAAVGAVIKLFDQLGSQKKASDEAMAMADQYKTLATSFEKYKEKVAGLSKDSTEYANANKDFRTSLLDVASGSTEAASAASEAAQSIDALTGVVTDGGSALSAYGEVLKSLEFKKLVESANAAEANLKNQTSFFQQLIDVGFEVSSMFGDLASNLMDAFISGLSGKSDEAKQAFIHAVKDPWDTLMKSISAADIEDKISAGKASFKEIQDYVNSLDFSRLTKSQETIVEAFNLMDERVSKALAKLMEMNDLDFSASADDIRQIAKQAGFSSDAIDDLVDKFNLLKEASSGGYDNIFEKWAEDAQKAGNSVDELIKKAEESGAKFTDSQKESLRIYEEEKRKLVEKYQLIKRIRDEALSEKGANKKEIYLKYYEKERELLKQSMALNREYANNTAKAIIEGFAKIDAELQIKLKKIDATWEKNSKQWAKHVVNAIAEAEKQKQLLVKKVFNPQELLKTAKSEVEAIKNTYALLYSELSQQVMKGTKSATQAAVERKVLERQEAAEISQIWKNTYQQISLYSKEGGKEATKAMLEASKTISASLRKEMEEMQNIAKEQESIAKEISDSFGASFSNIFDTLVKGMSVQPFEKLKAIIASIGVAMEEGLGRISEKQFNFDNIVKIDPTKSLGKIKSFLSAATMAFESIANKRIALAKKAAEIEARTTGDVVKAEKKAVREIEQIQKDLYEKKKSLYEKAKNAIIQALEASVAKEKEIINNLKEIQDAAKGALESLESKKTDLQRSLLSEIKKYKAELSDFRKAMSEGDKLLAAGKFKEAIETYRKAGEIAAKTAREIKDGEKTIISKSEATRKAIQMIDEAERKIKAAEAAGTDVLGKQLETQHQKSMQLKEVLENLVDVLNKLEVSLNKKYQLKIDADYEKLDEADKKIAEVGQQVEKIGGKSKTEVPIKIAVKGDEKAKTSVEQVKQLYDELKADMADSINIDLTVDRSKEEMNALAQAVTKLQEETKKPLNLIFGRVDNTTIDTAIQKVEQFNEAMSNVSQNSVSINVDTSEAEAKLAEVVSKADSLQTIDGNLVIVTDEAQRKLQEVSDEASSLFDNVDTSNFQSVLQSAAAALNTVIRSEGGVSETSRSMLQTLQEFASQYGYSVNVVVTGAGTMVQVMDQAGKAVESLRMSTATPFIFKADNSKVMQVLEEIPGVVDAVRQKAESDEIRIKADTTEAFDKVKEVKDTIASLDNEEVSPEIDVGKVTDGIEQINQLKSDIEDTDATSIKVDVDFSDFEEGSNEVDDFKESLDSVDNKKIEVEAEIKGKEEADDLADSIDNVEDKDVDIEASVDGEKDVTSLDKAIKKLKDKTVKVVAEVKGKDAVDNLANSIKKLHDKTVTITTRHVETREAGGVIGMAGGGSCCTFKRPRPYINRGSGIKDDVPALLMKGEYVINKRMVQKYGRKFFDALNYGFIDFTKYMPKFAKGGFVNKSRSRFGLPVKLNGTVFDIKHKSFYSYLMKKLNDLNHTGSINVAINMMNKTFNGTPPDLFPSDIIKRFRDPILKMRREGKFEHLSDTVKDLKSLAKMQTALSYSVNRNVVKGKSRRALDSNFMAINSMISSIPENPGAYLLSSSPLDNQIIDTFATGGFVNTSPIVTMASGGLVGAVGTLPKEKKRKRVDLCATGYAKIASINFAKAAAKLEKEAERKIERAKASLGISGGFRNTQDFIERFKQQSFEIALGMATGGSVDNLLDPNVWYREQKKLLDEAFKEDLRYMAEEHAQVVSAIYTELSSEVSARREEMQMRLKEIAQELMMELASLVEECRAAMADFDQQLIKAQHEYEDAVNNAKLEAKQAMDEARLEYAKEIDSINRQIEQEKRNLELLAQAARGLRHPGPIPSTTPKMEELRLSKKYAKEKYNQTVAKISAKLKLDLNKASHDLVDTRNDVYIKRMGKSRQTKMDENKAVLKSRMDSSSEKASAYREISKASVKARSDKRKEDVSYKHNVIARKIQYKKDLLALQEELQRKLAELQKQQRSGEGMTITHWMREGGYLGVPSGSKIGKDSILAMLAPKEYVINADAVSKFGVDFFDKLNKLKLPKFEAGGLVSDSSLTSFDKKSVQDSPVFNARLELAINDNVFELGATKNVAQQLLVEWNKARLRTI